MRIAANLLGGLVCIATLGAAHVAVAQPYPERGRRVEVQLPFGGKVDVDVRRGDVRRDLRWDTRPQWHRGRYDQVAYRLAHSADALADALREADLPPRDRSLARDARRFARETSRFYDAVRSQRAFPARQFDRALKNWRELDRDLRRLHAWQYGYHLSLARQIDRYMHQLDDRGRHYR